MLEKYSFFVLAYCDKIFQETYVNDAVGTDVISLSLTYVDEILQWISSEEKSFVNALKNPIIFSKIGLMFKSF